MGRSPPLRRLTVDGERYLWRRRHRHVEAAPGRERTCQELLRVHREGHPASPLELTFDWQGATAAMQDGLILVDGQWINLNQPGVVAALIRAARARGWQPERQRVTFAAALEALLRPA